jgi:uncharacterized membrane protein YcaP (DUF421 family)
METISYLFGPDDGNDLTALNMCIRALVVSAYCLLLLRISGRRAMALGAPLDNVQAILLGAILSRAVTGASPFLATSAAAATITLLHRLVSYLGMKSKLIGKMVKGQAKVVYRNGELNYDNLRYCRISERDLMAGVRLSSGLDSLEKVKTIYVERNGRISVIKKEKNHEE